MRVIAAHRNSRLRPPPPAGRSLPSHHVVPSPCAAVAAGRRERPSRAVAHAAVPRGGVRDGVRHLWVLLAGAGLLWGGLPRARATAPAAARERAASAQPGRPARSPGPPTGLPRAVSPPARDEDTPSPRPPRSTTIALPVGRAARRRVCLVCGRVWLRRRARRGPPARPGGAQRRKAPDDGDS